VSGTFWTIEQVEPIIRERNEMKDVVDVLNQRIAELEAENERLRETNEAIKRVTSEWRKDAEQIKELEYKLGMSRGNVDDLRKIRDEKDQRIAELEAENKRLDAHAREWGLKAQRAQADAERLLVLVTKWCDKDHHDWQEILKMGEKS